MSATPPIRLVATDMDGTLLASGGILPEDNIRAIRAAQEKGVVVAIASGRFVENAYIVLQEHGLRCPIIGANGAETVDENLRPLSEHFMDPAAARRVHDVLTAAEADYFIFARRAVCTARQSNPHHSELSDGEKITALGFTYLHGPQAAWECCQKPVHKFFVCNNHVSLAMLREQLSQIPGIELTQSAETNIEIMPTGIDKGMGVKDLARSLGVPLAQVMTLGDQENDIPMLRVAGYGTAVANASPATKAAARYITADHDACGFARALEKYVL